MFNGHGHANTLNRQCFEPRFFFIKLVVIMKYDYKKITYKATTYPNKLNKLKCKVNRYLSKSQCFHKKNIFGI